MCYQLKWYRVSCVSGLSLVNIAARLQTILHTGDMRWQSWMQQHPALASCQVDLLYMDTTYCLPKHTFPSQASVAVVCWQSPDPTCCSLAGRQLHLLTSLSSRALLKGRPCGLQRPSLCAALLLHAQQRHPAQIYMSLFQWCGSHQ